MFASEQDFILQGQTICCSRCGIELLTAKVDVLKGDSFDKSKFTACDEIDFEEMDCPRCGRHIEIGGTDGVKWLVKKE